LPPIYLRSPGDSLGSASAAPARTTRCSKRRGGQGRPPRPSSAGDVRAGHLRRRSSPVKRGRQGSMAIAEV